MKTFTQDQEIIEKADQLFHVRGVMKDLANYEKELKEDLKKAMAERETNALVAGQYVMTIKDQVKKIIDMEMIKALLGEEFQAAESIRVDKTFHVSKV